ncbi:HAMP domain-containing protein [Sinimarinibacterium sp. CAU 1509]|uniref:ATP-binding protein n=1 Tax=Sinimarinibacterium sp. CAU 1509 TaxID=2562283 RepID=UPI0010ABA05F|nr:ATP-binding protein [Sinimarinibacterium sp. CAU 1509]TJY64956.1 HAMP domain-containing protein [Sinimarinibacterium sp. CAU 1509]
MRSPLFWKLFVVQVCAALLLVSGALAIQRAHTAHSFSEYVELQQRAQMRELAERIAEGVASGDTLIAAAREVFREGRRAARQQRDANGPPPRAAAPPVGPQGRAPLRVVDGEGRAIIGQERPYPSPGEPLREPIELDDRTIGYVVHPPLPQSPAGVDDARFSQRQTRAAVLVALAAVPLAALFAGLITVMILRPIHTLSDGVSALAQRRFTTRLPVNSGDELGRLAQGFNHLAEALERFDARQRQWLADIAHELRTPLAVLRGELEAVIDGVRPADNANVRSLHQESLRLTALVEDLHLLSSAESGGLALHREPNDIAALVRDTGQRFAGRYADAGYVLEIAVEDDDALTAAIDLQRIEQVLANLLENALRHAQPGPVALRACRRGSGIEISVCDAGPGVPEALLPKLFDRLFRADVARARGGSGLGLAICRSIVEAHGGSIEASRSELGGLCVRIILPVNPA